MFAQTVPSPAIEKINWQAPAGLELPRLNEIHLDGAVLGFAVLLAVATSVVFGLAPAVRHRGWLVAGIRLADGAEAPEGAVVAGDPKLLGVGIVTAWRSRL